MTTKVPESYSRADFLHFPKTYLYEVAKISNDLVYDQENIEQVMSYLNGTKNLGGRVFVLGVGGSAANASHAVNDLRKICGIEAYAVTDNVAELTARTNDDGWESVFVEWLKRSRIGAHDVVFVLSVGGGTKTATRGLVPALHHAKAMGAGIVGITGPDGGYTAQIANACVKIPADSRITAHTEAFQMVLLHLMVSHPRMRE